MGYLVRQGKRYVISVDSLGMSEEIASRDRDPRVSE